MRARKTPIDEIAQTIGRHRSTIYRELKRNWFVEHGIGQHALELAVLVFQRPKPLGLGHIHPAELGFPFVDAGIAHAMLATQVSDRDARLVLRQDADDLFFRKTTALHVLVLCLGQNELQAGLSPGGNVSDHDEHGRNADVMSLIHGAFRCALPALATAWSSAIGRVRC